MLAWVAVTGGVSLALSVVITDSSVGWSFSHFSEKVAGGAQLRVIGATARAGLRGSVLAGVQSTPGVAAAVPVVEANTVLRVGSRRRGVFVVGVPYVTHVEVSSTLAAFLARPIPVGSGPPRVATDHGPVPLIGTVTARPLDSLAHGDVVLMPLTTSQSLFGRGTNLDAIYVVPGRGVFVHALATVLARAVGPWNGVVPAGSLPPEATVVTRAFLPLLALLSLLAIGVSIVLVHDIVDLAVTERRRSMAVLAAIGAKPAQITLTVVDMAMVGIAGGIAGVAGGALVASSVIGTLDRLVRALTGVSLGLHVSSAIMLLAPVGGLVIAAVAAFGPCRRALRIDVAAELSGRVNAAEARGRLHVLRGAITGGLAALGLTGCWVSSLHGSLRRWQFPLGVIAFGLLIIFTMLAVGNAAPVAFRAAGRRSSGQLPSLRLALANLARSPTRTGTMAVAVAGAVGLAFVAASFNRSVADAIGGSVNVRHARWDYVSLDSPAAVSIDSEQRFSEAELAALARVPGAARVVRQEGVLTGIRAVVGVESSDDLGDFGIPVIEGSDSPALLQDGEGMTGPVLARNRQLHPGSILSLDTPGGIAHVRIAGIWANGDFNGNSVLVSQEEMTALYGPQPPVNVYVYARRGVDLAEFARRIEKAHIAPDLYASTPPQAAAAGIRAAVRQIAPFWTLQKLMTALSFVAVLSTLVLAGVQRRREYALLAATGYTPSDIGRMVMVEGAAVGAAGAALGGVVGVVGTAGIILVTPLVIGYRDPYVLAPSYWLAYGAIGVVVTLAASLLPSWRAMRIPVLDALREE